MTTIICHQHLHAMARAARATLDPINNDVHDEREAGRPEADQRTPSADMALHLRVASDKFGELAAIFDIIERRTDEQDDLHKLARLGKDVAQDYEEQAACWREKLEAEAMP